MSFILSKGGDFVYGECFLKILKTALEGAQVNPDFALTDTELREVLRLAEIHKVLPLIFDAAFTAIPQGDRENIRAHVKLLVSRQTLTTERFLASYKALNSQGLYPIVVKGIICRNIYPKPDLRCSSDEDLLIEPSQEKDYIGAMDKLGLVPLNDNNDTHYQSAYVSTSGIYIELHRSLFSDSSELFSKCNKSFEGAKSKSISVLIGDTEVRTLSHTDHLLFLILHALKHFISSGVGIRQVCDIALFANTFGNTVDWDYIYNKCSDLNALEFAAAILKIGSRYLTLDYTLAGIPKRWQELDPDEEPLLEDILCAGIYGSSHRARQHSSGITLDAATGKKNSLRNRLFPSAKSLSAQYSYVAKSPLLLPVAWSHRILRYSKEIDTKTNNTPLNSVKIGNKRLQLLKKYNIIP